MANTSRLECCPLPILSDILDRSSNGGEVGQLVLYSTVSKKFAEAVKGVQSLTLADLNLIGWPPEDRASFLARCVWLTLNIETLRLDVTFDPSMQMVGPCILYWSVVIGSKLTTFKAKECNFTASHLNALSELKALNHLSFQDCKITSKKGINKTLFENVEELFLYNLNFDCTEGESLHFLLEHIPRLQVLLYNGNEAALFPLDIDSKSLTSMAIISCGKLVVNTPTIRELFLGAPLVDFSNYTMTHLTELRLRGLSYSMPEVKKIQLLLEGCPSLEIVKLEFQIEKVDPLVAIECVTEVTKLKSLYPYVEFILPWDSCLNYDRK